MTRFLSKTVACLLALTVAGLLVSAVGAVVINNLEMVPCEGQTVTHTPYGINYPQSAEMVCIEIDLIRAYGDSIDVRILDVNGVLWRESTILPSCPALQCHTWGVVGFCPGPFGCVPSGGDVWPIGFYHLDFLPNGELVRSLPFSVGIKTVYLPLILK